jgi:hypothetical protein
MQGSKDKFRGGRGEGKHTPHPPAYSPFIRSLLHLTLQRKDAEQEEKQLPENERERWHIAAGQPKVGSSRHLQGAESAEQQFLK